MKGRKSVLKTPEGGLCQILFGYDEILEYLVIFQTPVTAEPAARAAVCCGGTKAALTFLLLPT